MLVTRYDGGLVTGMYYFRNIFTKGAGLNSSALCIIFRGKRHFFSKLSNSHVLGRKSRIRTKRCMRLRTAMPDGARMSDNPLCSCEEGAE